MHRIALVLARHGFGEVVARLGLSVPRLPGSPAPPSEQERLARRLADTLSELGPIYIKLGQLLASRADLFPPDVVRALSALHASVRPLPWPAVQRSLEAELGRPYQLVFTRVESRCLAAASIAQVHRATLRDGSEVVIKLQRPGLRAQVEADLSIMRVLARLLAQNVPEVAAYAPVALVEAFADSIAQELDFRTEAANAFRLRQLLAGAAEVRLPLVHEAFTTERLLVMEYVAGAHVGALEPALRGRARRALLRAFVRQTIEHGVFHADPHPGNLLGLPDGRVALLDLGNIAVLDEALRVRLWQLCLALLLRRNAALCGHVVALSQVNDAAAVDRARLERDVEAFLRTSAGADGSAMFAQLLAISRTHGLRLPAALLALMRALTMLDGVLRGLDPGANIVRDLRRELVHANLRRIGRVLGARVRRLVELAARGARRALDRVQRTGRSAGPRAAARPLLRSRPMQPTNGASSNGAGYASAKLLPPGAPERAAGSHTERPPDSAPR